MKTAKKTTLWDRLRNAARAFCGKPANSITLGVEVKRCDECDYKRAFNRPRNLCHHATREPVRVTAIVTGRRLDGLPLTKAEIQCRVHRALAEELTKEIIEKELYTIAVHDDPMNCAKQYHAVIDILPPLDRKEAEG